MTQANIFSSPLLALTQQDYLDASALLQAQVILFFWTFAQVLFFPEIHSLYVDLEKSLNLHDILYFRFWSTHIQIWRHSSSSLVLFWKACPFSIWALMKLPFARFYYRIHSAISVISDFLTDKLVSSIYTGTSLLLIS